MDSIRLLQINTLGATLSTGRTVRELHDYLQSHGMASFIACPRNNDCADAFAFSSLNQIHLDVLLSIVTGLEGTHSLLPTWKLLRYIDAVQPNIVHLRVLHCHCLNFRVLLNYLARKKIPVVLTMHDLWYITGQCVYFTASGCDKWQTGCGHCPNLAFGRHKPLLDRTRELWAMKKRLFGKLDRLAVIGVSDWVTEQVRHSFLSDAAVVRRIYNWIDLDAFRPLDPDAEKKALGLDGRRVILGISAVWKHGDRKGLDAYIALSEVLPEDWTIVLVGEKGFSETLNDRILLLEKTDDLGQLAAYYSMADVYLNLSREEAFGKVSAEALACGTPVVALDSTANRELVPQGAGFVLRSLDPQEIMEKLNALFERDKAHYTPICRRFAQENFEKETNIKDYLAVYAYLLHGAPGAAADAPRPE